MLAPNSPMGSSWSARFLGPPKVCVDGEWVGAVPNIGLNVTAIPSGNVGQVNDAKPLTAQVDGPEVTLGHRGVPKMLHEENIESALRGKEGATSP